MNCNNCGFNLNDGANFCPACGSNTMASNEANTNLDPFANPTNTNLDPFSGNPSSSSQNGFNGSSSTDPFGGHNNNSFNNGQNGFSGQGFNGSQHFNSHNPHHAGGHIHFDQETINQQMGIRRLNRAMGNGIFGIVFSIWTLIVVFGGLFDSWWMLVFILIDLTSSIPAIIGAIRNRQFSRPKFIAALTMGIVSTVVSVGALIYWITL